MNKQQKDALIIILSSLVVAALSIWDFVRAGKPTETLDEATEETPVESKEEN